MYNKHTQQSSHISMAHPNWTNCKIYKLFKAAYNLISVMVESFKVVQTTFLPITNNHHSKIKNTIETFVTISYCTANLEYTM